MIRRDRDKASIILWSVANETPVTPARVDFLKVLVAKAHELDPARLVTAASVSAHRRDDEDHRRSAWTSARCHRI
jgi:hypothetical protein